MLIETYVLDMMSYVAIYPFTPPMTRNPSALLMAEETIGMHLPPIPLDEFFLSFILPPASFSAGSVPSAVSRCHVCLNITGSNILNCPEKKVIMIPKASLNITLEIRSALSFCIVADMNDFFFFVKDLVAITFKN